MGFQKILAALDHSQLSEAVFAQAIDLSRKNQAELTLFHCLLSDAMGEPIPSAIELGLYPEIVNQAYEVLPQRIDEQIRQGETLLNRYQAIAAQQSVQVGVRCQIGSPGPLLCQMALSCHADLIVLGRRGRKGLTEVLLGSVSNYVLHHAPCSVLVIQAGAEDVAVDSTRNAIAQRPAEPDRF